MRSAAAFESPKQAAHGDLACTAAMQLAKPLKQNPRELAQALVDALARRPAVQRWVEAMEIAGPGFINLRLTAAAKQTVVAEVLAAGAAYGRREPATTARARRWWSNSSRPTRPARCTPATRARPRSATRSATCSNGRAGR